jgi:hypothetical protein
VAADETGVEADIQYLVDFVANSNVTFIRNAKEYTAEEAAQHMMKKYAHFRDEITTAEDFIRLAATKSLISGEPYLVQTQAGKEMRSDDWLHEILEDYRKSKPQDLPISN